jgi:AcrR family transcriptional regulator
VTRRPDHLSQIDLDNLPETAQRIVDASERILATRGWKGLTIGAISAEAGVYVPAVSYYFGGKQGLISVLFDSLLRKSTRAMLESVRNLPSGTNRVDAVAEALKAQWRIMGPEGYAAYFETFPHLLRNRQARQLTLERNATYEDAIVTTLTGRADAYTRRALRPHAALFLAVLDGLAARRLLDPENDLFDEAVNVFSALLSAGLRPVESMGGDESGAYADDVEGEA